MTVPEVDGFHRKLAGNILLKNGILRVGPQASAPGIRFLEHRDPVFFSGHMQRQSQPCRAGSNHSDPGVLFRDLKYIRLGIAGQTDHRLLQQSHSHCASRLFPKASAGAGSWT